MATIKRSEITCFFTVSIYFVLLSFAEINAQSTDFSTPVFLGEMEASNVTDFKFADIDRDGDNDILISTTSEISWFENNGTGEFSPKKIIIEIENDDPIGGFDAGDVNNDGEVDIIWFVKNQPGFRLSLNAGETTFLPSREYAIEYGPLRNIAVSRILPDSLNGVIMATGGVEGLLYRNIIHDANPDSLVFDDWIQISPDKIQPDQATGEFFTADVNKNGFSDYLMYESSYSSYSSIGLYLNQENSYEFNKIHEGVFQIFTDVKAGDLDQDGDVDLISTSQIRGLNLYNLLGSIFWYENTGNETYSEPVKVDSIDVGFKSAVLLDVDNDGLEDIVAVSIFQALSKGEIYWWKNEGNGSFSSRKFFAETNVTFDQISKSDLDGDGAEDLVAYSTNGGEFMWFKIEDDGLISKHLIAESDVSAPADVLSFDVDQDGYNDLVVSSHTAAKGIQWFKNKGDFTFHKPETIESSMRDVFQIESFDVNNDGLLDITALSSTLRTLPPISEHNNPAIYESSLVWYRNLGDGTFSEANTIWWGDQRATGFSMGDFNGDGDLDASLNVANYIELFENRGGGDFADATVIADSLSFSEVNIFADINHDGKDEVVTSQRVRNDNYSPVDSRYIEDHLIYIENNGNQPRQIKFEEYDQLGSKVNSISAADINSNGKTDIIVGNWSYYLDVYTEGSFTLLVQTDIDTVYKKSLTDLNFSGYADLHFSDLTNSGVPDILTISNHHYDVHNTLNDGIISWYENDGTGSFHKKDNIDSLVVSMQNVVATDLNNDGYKEVVVISRNSNFVAIYANEMGGPNVSSESDVRSIPSQVQLAQNYPNPFNPVTNISYSVPAAGQVELTVFNLLGQQVQTLVSDYKTAGNYQVQFDAGNLSSGLYLYQLKTGKSIINKKMLLVK